MKDFSFLFKAGLLVGLLFSFASSAVAQAPSWQSARAVATATAAAAGNYSVVNSTVVDVAGNVFLAGYFRNSVVLGGTTLTSFGNYDVFVAKFNPANNQFVWAQRAGGTGADYATSLAVSGTSVYVAGYFSGSPAGFGSTTLNDAGYGDVFVAKLTDAGSTGSFVWAQRAGGIFRDYAYALAVSGTNVYVAGEFESPTAGFGSATLTNVSDKDVFVAKLSDAGSTGIFVWAQRAGGRSRTVANALAVSGTSVYVAGNFYGSTADFGLTRLTNTGAVNVFVAKLADAGSTGSFVWAQGAGGTDGEAANALAVSGTSVYVAGEFGSSTARFGSITLTNAGANSGRGDVFVAKLTDTGSTGSFVWAQRAGGTGSDYATALVVSGTSLYVAGDFYGSTTRFGTATLTNAGASGADVFVAKLTDTGSFEWAQQAGGTGNDAAHALAVSGTRVFMAGDFNSPTASFGNITITNPTPNTSLGFLASLTDPTLTATAAGRALTPAQLFPNPARRTATLRLPTGTPSIPLTLTDALGRTVRRYPAPAGPETALDLGGLPAGLYLLRGAGAAQRLAVE